MYYENLPKYINKYVPDLESRKTQYNRPHPLPVPRVTHAYAESCFLYNLVKMKNKLATCHILIIDKIVNSTHSTFSKYVINIMIDNYSYECI